jgi:hypothetical protein
MAMRWISVDVPRLIKLMSTGPPVRSKTKALPMMIAGRAAAARLEVTEHLETDLASTRPMLARHTSAVHTDPPMDSAPALQARPSLVIHAVLPRDSAQMMLVLCIWVEKTEKPLVCAFAWQIACPLKRKSVAPLANNVTARSRCG